MENPPAGHSAEKNLIRIHALSRIGIAGVWIYHGLVPKLIFRDWSEMTILHDLGVDIQFVPALLQNLGCLEVAFGVLVLALWSGRWQLWATMGIMVGGLLGLAQHSPTLLHAAFNPVSLNGMMFVLAVIALISQPPPAVKS